MVLDLLLATGSAAERRFRKFENWLEKLPRWHDYFVWTPNPEAAWSTPVKALSEARVALVSTAGVHLRNQPRFDVDSPDGDSSYRIIPADAAPSDFLISDTHYDHADGDQDINCIFGLHRLHELAAEGVIGAVAPRHFGLMGFVPNPASLIAESAPAVAAALAEDAVDLVLLTPG